MNKSVLGIALIFLGLQGCATEGDFQKQGLTAMTALEIKEKLTGNSLVGVTGKGYQVTWFLRQNGTIEGINGTGAARNSRDSGVWDTGPNGDFCTQWKNWGEGKKGCYKLYLVGNDIRTCRSDGNCSGQFKIVQGNPDHL